MMESDFKIDLFHNLKGFTEADFDACFKRVKMLRYKVSIHVLKAKDLLHEKESAAPEKNQGDISFLRKMISKLSQMNQKARFCESWWLQF